MQIKKNEFLCIGKPSEKEIKNCGEKFMYNLYVSVLDSLEKRGVIGKEQKRLIYERLKSNMKGAAKKYAEIRNYKSEEQ